MGPLVRHTVIEFVFMRLLQMSTCYCSSTHHPHCSSQQQHYRSPVNPLPYNCPQSQNLPQQQGMNTAILQKIHVNYCVFKSLFSYVINFFFWHLDNLSSWLEMRTICEKCDCR